MTRWIVQIVIGTALLTALVALMALAYATPPDPTWVSGIFDDDDNDNGVYFVTSSTATLDPFPLCRWSAFRVRWTTLAQEDREPASSHCFSTVEARAPPVS